MSGVQVSIFSPARGWRERSPTKTAALRALLSDGQRHSQQALQRVAGMRFGARLFDAHNGDCVPGATALHYEKIRESEGDAKVFYRITDRDHCDICTKEAGRKPSEIIEAQAKRISELEKENEGLKIRLAYAEGKS